MNSAPLPLDRGKQLLSKMGMIDRAVAILALASLTMFALSWFGIHLNLDRYSAPVDIVLGFVWLPLILSPIVRRMGGRAGIVAVGVALVLANGLFVGWYWVTRDLQSSHILIARHPDTRAVFYVAWRNGLFFSCEQAEVARLGGWLVQRFGVENCEWYSDSPPLDPKSMRFEWFDGPHYVALAASRHRSSAPREVFLDVFRYTTGGAVKRVALVPQLKRNENSDADFLARDAKIRALVGRAPHTPAPTPTPTARPTPTAPPAPYPGTEDGYPDMGYPPAAYPPDGSALNGSQSLP